ncbi:SDR family NAD(P)-dependent oxidoreductase [Halomonas sp.]|uniref:SDR family NAD(P)-dependent oxidoreductase n=1 Tax=Halomonas sp. TaxID=1486246 RepID=UPI0026030393|nr:SDR family oxidoreductase [Halomonas sp.]
MPTHRIALLGAAGGLGGAIAETLLTRGHRVWLLDLPERHDALMSLARHWPDQASVLACDFRHPGTITAAFATLGEQAACLDACVNAAGVIHRAGFMDTALEDLERVMAINVTGPFLALQQAVTLMPRGGRIVNIASAHGLRTGPERSAYAMSKGAILALTRALAVELGPREILVNAVAPGPVSTGMQDASSDSRRRWQAATPLGRVAEAQEVARAVAFLVSAENTFISGDTLMVDGGATAMI